jgi:hypothetical protein
METELLFEEIQQFSKTGSRRIIQILSFIFLIGSLLILFTNEETKFQISISFFGSSVAFGLINLVFNKVRLIMQIRTDGIYVSFPPLRNNFTICYWENIDKLFIREYDPIREYGGWGLKGKGNNLAFCVEGNIGVQLILMNDAKLLIGTNQPEEIASVLARLGKLDYLIEK